MRRAIAAAAALMLVSGGCHGQTKPAPAPAVDRTPKGRAILDWTGVMIGPNKGHARYYAFGTPRGVVDAAAARTFVQPLERAANRECGAGPMEFTRVGAITLNYRGGKLVGWLIGEGPQAVTTDGVTPGTMLRDLKVTRSVRTIAGSTLPGEFEYLAADGHPIGGFTTGAGHDARITKLFAGETCLFR